jgi:copper chaperone CopZ
MKTCPSTAFALVALALGCGEAPVSNGPTQTIVSSVVEEVAFNTAGAPTVAFDVPGMHCEHMCKPKVEETLAALPGVVDVKVEIATKVATVAVDKEKFDAEKAIAALVEADFEGTTLHADAAEASSDEPATEEQAPKTES